MSRLKYKFKFIRKVVVGSLEDITNAKNGLILTYYGQKYNININILVKHHTNISRSP